MRRKGNTMRRLTATRRAMLLAAAAFLTLGAEASIAAAETLQKQVAEGGKLTIGIYNSWPWGFTENGKVAGVGPEIFEAAVKPRGVKDIEFQVMDFSALVPSLAAKRIDVIVGGMYIKPKRCKEVAFSDPVGGPEGNTAPVKEGNPLKIHSYEDLAKNPNARVANLRSAASNEPLLAAEVPKDRLQQYPDKDAALGALMPTELTP